MSYMLKSPPLFESRVDIVSPTLPSIRAACFKKDRLWAFNTTVLLPTGLDS